MPYRLVTFVVHTPNHNKVPDYEEIQDWRRQVGFSEADIYEDKPFRGWLPER